MQSLDLRFRLLVAGVALDIFAPPRLDLSSFEDRARRYARPDGGIERTSNSSPIERIEVRGYGPGEVAPAEGPLPRERVVDGWLQIDTAGAMLMMSRAAGLTRATVDLAAEHPVFENVLRVVLSRRIVQHGGVVLHAAGLHHDGVGVVFPGESGAGKSTLTLRHPNDERISEDLLALRPTPGGGSREPRWSIDALPFIAAHRLDLGPKSAPLHALAFPRHAHGVGVRRLSPHAALLRLAPTVVSFAPDGLERLLLDRLVAVAGAAPAFDLALDRTTPFWPDLHAALGAQSVSHPPSIDPVVS